MPPAIASQLLMQITSRTASTEARDEQLLESLGYKQELKRDISLFSNFAVSFSIISLLTGVMSKSQVY